MHQIWRQKTDDSQLVPRHNVNSETNDRLRSSNHVPTMVQVFARMTNPEPVSQVQHDSSRRCFLGRE